jgi:hypothetical protein
MDNTMAKIGRSMKNRASICRPSHFGVEGCCGTGTTSCFG